jgi:four helix bundle protein
MNQAVHDRYDLQKRTKSFAVQVIRLSKDFSKGYESQYIRRQLIRSAASVAANYRAARRGRSRREFIAKLSIVIEECDEASFWIELGAELKVCRKEQLHLVLQEANELTAIFVASRCTARKRLAEAGSGETVRARPDVPRFP